MLYISNTNQNQNKQEQICIGGRKGGQIKLYEIQQQQQQQIKLLQIFPQEHPSSDDDYIYCLLQINPNTLVSSASGYSSDSDNVLVIWSKSKSSRRCIPILFITASLGVFDSVVKEKISEIWCSSNPIRNDSFAASDA